MQKLRLLVVQGKQFVATCVRIDVLLTRGRQYKALDVLHEYLLLVIASPVQLPVSLVDVGLDLGELLERPLRDINQNLDLVPRCGIKPRDGPGELLTELAVIPEHKVEDVGHFSNSLEDIDTLVLGVFW